MSLFGRAIRLGVSEGATDTVAKSTKGGAGGARSGQGGIGSALKGNPKQGRDLLNALRGDSPMERAGITGEVDQTSTGMPELPTARGGGKLASAAQFMNTLNTKEATGIANAFVDPANDLYARTGLTGNRVAQNPALDSGWQPHLATEGPFSHINTRDTPHYKPGGGQVNDTTEESVDPMVDTKPGAVQPGQMGLTSDQVPAVRTIFSKEQMASVPFSTPNGGTGAPSDKGPYDVATTKKAGKKPRDGGLGRGLGEILTDYNRDTKS